MRNKCSKCGTPGHKATTCPNPAKKKAAAPVRSKGRSAQERKAKPGRRARVTAGASAPAVAQDLLANAREKAGALVRQKIEEELAWAEAYVAELKRVGGIA